MLLLEDKDFVKEIQSNFIVKGITIHNTSNSLSAQENVELAKELQLQGNLISVHFFVDEKNVIPSCPLSENSWHTGMGWDFGNMHTISIEICRNFDDDLYPQAESNAVALIKSLMSEYLLGYKDIYFHSDFDINTDCPRRINSEGTKEDWLRKYQFLEEYEQL